MNKLLLWLPKNVASILGIAQAIVKLAKEILTAIVNILFPVIPSKNFQDIVDKVRSVVNKIDEILEKVKGYVLKIGV